MAQMYTPGRGIWPKCTPISAILSHFPGFDVILSHFPGFEGLGYPGTCPCRVVPRPYLWVWVPGARTPCRTPLMAGMVNGHTAAGHRTKVVHQARMPFVADVRVHLPKGLEILIFNTFSVVRAPKRILGETGKSPILAKISGFLAILSHFGQNG